MQQKLYLFSSLIKQMLEQEFLLKMTLENLFRAESNGLNAYPAFTSNLWVMGNSKFETIDANVSRSTQINPNHFPSWLPSCFAFTQSIEQERKDRITAKDWGKTFGSSQKQEPEQSLSGAGGSFSTGQPCYTGFSCVNRGEHADQLAGCVKETLHLSDGQRDRDREGPYANNQSAIQQYPQLQIGGLVKMTDWFSPSLRPWGIVSGDNNIKCCHLNIMKCI